MNTDPVLRKRSVKEGKRIASVALEKYSGDAIALPRAELAALLGAVASTGFEMGFEIAEKLAEGRR